MISRRHLFAAGLASSTGLWAQEQAPFTLDFGDIELEPQSSIKVAVVTTGYTSCQVEIVDKTGKTVAQTPDWGTEPNRANSIALPAPKQKGAFGAKARLRPTSNRKPSVGLAVSQDLKLDLKMLEKFADKVRFVRDPSVRATEGHFELELPDKSTVTVQIYAGEARAGAPVYQVHLDNVGPGPTNVPWNLRTNRGAIAPAGRYLAYLLCGVNTYGRRSTAMFSTFGIVDR